MILVKNVVIAVLGIAMALVVYAIVKQGGFLLAPAPIPTEGQATTTPPYEHDPAVSYRNDTYGMSFSYPAGYTLTEYSESDDGTGHALHTMSLFRSEDL